MSQVEYTDANREKLAEAVVENMDIKDMIQALYEQELECYEQDEDTFQELWHNYYGINLMVGDEVYWNDPDEDTCSGLGIFVRYLDDGAAVIRKDDVEIEVFVKEEMKMSKHTHIFDFCFSVTTDSDDWEKVSPEQLRLSLINRVADLPMGEYGEACGYVDSTEEQE